MHDVTLLLARIEQGDSAAANDLLPLIYQELRRLARQQMLRERPDLTLQATALVHEAYLRLVDGPAPQRWQTRGHFFAAAAESMRRILVEAARRRQTLKQGRGAARVDLEQIDLPAPELAEDVLGVDEALIRLEAADPQAAQLVKLRYFAGLTLPEIAELLQLSPRSVDRLWSYAMAWLHRELRSER